MKKIEVQINMEYICLKNNTAQLYFVLGRVDLDFIFSVYLGMTLIFTNFQQCTWPTPTSC